MSLTALDDELAARVADDAGDDADRDVGGSQYRPLLDVDLEEPARQAGATRA
jgi:hypothetical protein